MAKNGFFNDAVVGQTDLFSMFGIEDSKEEESAAVTEEDEDAAESDETDAAKPAAKKASSDKPKKPSYGKKDMDGPVEVIGCGWTETYGESGKKYAAKQIIKMAYDAGYLEVAAAGLKYKENTIYVQSVSESPSDDQTSCKGGIKVILGQQAASISADICEVDDDELSLLDVAEKITALVPDYKGCGLKVNISAGIAVPVFDKKISMDELILNNDYRVWSSEGIKEVSGQDIAAFYDGYDLYVSDEKVIFPCPVAPKGALSFSVKAEELGLTEKKAGKVKEVFTLPMKICLSNYNQIFDVTSQDFGGKAKVDRDDVLNWLRPQYRAFKSTSRKFDFCYNKKSAELAVMIISGEKGASASFFTLPAASGQQGVRVERTPVGLFKGRTEENGDVTSLSFKFAMEKIPYSILEQVISMFRADLNRECIVQIYWNEREGYYVRETEYSASKAYLTYKPVLSRDVLVMTIHSHNTMRARFSSVDDGDEIYTGLFGVIGRLKDSMPEMSFRAGMEGCFQMLSPRVLFAGGVA